MTLRTWGHGPRPVSLVLLRGIFEHDLLAAFTDRLDADAGTPDVEALRRSVTLRIFYTVEAPMTSTAEYVARILEIVTRVVGHGHETIVWARSLGAAALAEAAQREQFPQLLGAVLSGPALAGCVRPSARWGVSLLRRITGKLARVFYAFGPARRLVASPVRGVCCLGLSMPSRCYGEAAARAEALAATRPASLLGTDLSRLGQVLCLLGDGDAAVCTREVAALIQTANVNRGWRRVQFRPYPGCAHWVELERPGILATTLLELLSSAGERTADRHASATSTASTLQ